MGQMNTNRLDIFVSKFFCGFCGLKKIHENKGNLYSSHINICKTTKILHYNYDKLCELLWSMHILLVPWATGCGLLQELL